MKHVLDKLWCQRARIFERVTVQKLRDYDYTQRQLRLIDVKADRVYQRKYNGFYVMRTKPASWYEFYYGLLEREKYNDHLTFEAVLQATFRVTGQVHPSFSSKLVATVRPELPVYDSVVCTNLGIRKPNPSTPAQTRITAGLRAYEEIGSFFSHSLPDDRFAALKAEFDERLPEFAHFTPTKKLDILLWKMPKGG